ncbi:M4 family metallopeptidase [Hyalangium rubrum]|uniref:M4 family metallopeptidase n=1 Tax=Hyalangium rubrum TaxID=3103134 RepID=A0ABU5GX48_9BACT|nr:M4 family metallopeptidase [Hyalangium sp. s54d21]MDY7225769.1 M4 family metallopeptidase [Hyalangium sp. s54d21]
MLSNKILKTFCAAWLGLTFAACGTTDPTGAEDTLAVTGEKNGADIQTALSALSSASVLATQADQVTPAFIKGNLGRVSAGRVAADADAALRDIAPVFRLRAEDLVFKRASKDERGHTYLRYGQTRNGLQVIGSELLLMVNPEGVVYAANSSAYDVALGAQVASQASIALETAEVAAKGADTQVRSERTGRRVYVRGSNGGLVLAHEVRVTGMRDGQDVEDLVYVNATNGSIALRAPKIKHVINRAVYSANNGSSLPGALKRSEGGAATGDTHVDDNYGHLGTTYQCYFQNFGRDSYNNAGAQLKSTVHYSTSYTNAYWNGSQMVYGDSDGVDSAPLGKSLDVTVHELTHAVTEYESNLIYSYESGALNEGMSDIFAAYCESWTLNWATPASVWMIGDDVWTPGTEGDALRYMGNPTQDGSSKDYYPERYMGSSDNGGVHWNSGIANLAFKLLSTGGTHPRGKTNVNVTGITIQKAGKIFYEANANCMTTSSNFAAARTCTEQKAEQHYGAAEKASTAAAWEAVGVGGGTTPPPSCSTDIVLSNGVAVTGVQGNAGEWSCTYTLTVPAGQSSLVFALSGGTGDGDMFVRYGSAPTATSYDCRPYDSGNNETCTHSNPAAGTWYVKVNAYSTFSGASLKGTYTGSTGNQLTNGVATAAYNGAASAMTCWTLQVPAGKSSVVFNQAGGTGDADLYVRYNAPPTTTSYNCRPYLDGNNETCTLSAPFAGTWYACTRGYSAYTGVTMKGTY